MDDIARRLYSAAQVRELDRRAIEQLHMPGYTLMQRAGSACWQLIRRRWPAAERITVVCGNGNNGGDGYVIARLAHEAGRRVTVVAVGGVPQRGDAVLAHADWLAAGGAVQSFSAAALEGAELLVDALFGIGLSRPVAGEPAAAIAAICAAHRAGTPVLAVDLPSGLDADTGQVWGDAVEADVTLGFIGRKLGTETGAGPQKAGQRWFDPLGLPPQLHAGLQPLAELMQAEDLPRWLPPRPRDAHKGRHGHVLVVGGDSGMAGAALLAGRAALRAGAGLVTVATRRDHAVALTAAQPELMCHAVESAAALRPLMERADVVAVGPGLSQGDWGRLLFAAILEGRQPLVIDADGLTLLAQEPAQSDRWILTPHPGEAGRLLGCSTAEVQRDRPAAVHALQQRYGGTVVLKGAGSLVCGRGLQVCAAGNPGMAVAGMGDTLTGIIAALIGQGLVPDEAAAAGVLVHALAGDRAARQGERGLLPTDLIAEIRSLVNPPAVP